MERLHRHFDSYSWPELYDFETLELEDDDNQTFAGLRFFIFLKTSVQSLFILKHVKYEFYFNFLEYFFLCCIRFFFL